MGDYQVVYKTIGDCEVDIHTKEGVLYKLEYDDVTYYKDAAIKFLKDRNCTFEELIEES
tara:strand:- start:2341 stop:2517 length:177 start_codon:yes stop_codon:yes gene_type:complete